MQVLTFIIICLVVYFIIVLPMNAALNKLYVSALASLHTLSEYCRNTISSAHLFQTKDRRFGQMWLHLGDLECASNVVSTLS